MDRHGRSFREEQKGLAGKKGTTLVDEQTAFPPKSPQQKEVGGEKKVRMRKGK